jgi:hypothetical protein
MAMQAFETVRDSLVVHIDLEHRAELLRQQPDIYYITDHSAPHATVLVRLSKITRTDLSELLRDACRFVSSSASTGARPTRRPTLASRGAAAREKH